MMLQFRRYLHVPVLLGEVLQALKVRAGGRYIDGTVGEGGHASAILEHSSPGGRLLCIDADPEALEAARARLRPYGQAATLVNDNFRNLKAICHQLDFHPVDGIMFDLGLSSLQLGASDRGFSFQTDAPLDMRFNPSQETTAATIVNTYPEQELAHIIESYGEDHRSRQIARAIIARRPINTTLQLAAVVERVVGSRRRIHPATRTFQALRIAVNQELESLEAALEQSPALLAAGGRLTVISYHSLEDRIVKDYLRRESRDCLCPPQTPACICGHKATLKIVTKKPTVPSSDEIRHNPRSRSAKMRVAERI